MEKIKEIVLQEYQKGNIVVVGIEGLQVMPINEFIKQPTEGMLYDLNRNEVVVLTFLPDPKWINDYAVAKVIAALKNRINELENPSPPNTIKKNWIKTAKNPPPDKLTLVRDKYGNEATAQPCIYHFDIINNKVVFCKPYWDGGWLIQAIGLEAPTIGEIVEYMETI